MHAIALPASIVAADALNAKNRDWHCNLPLLKSPFSLMTSDVSG